MTVSTWENHIRWDEAWDTLNDLPGGGQGTAKLVRHRSGEPIAFLKLLSRQNDAERRARFFREATAYDTCKHTGIPRLIQSNAHLHDDVGRKLYIATEYIDGATLYEHIRDTGTFNFNDALRMLRGLLDIVSHLHREDWVHRDIKPDNIILRNRDSACPALVDFGLGFKDGLITSFDTEHGQEIGNRFLRLPELSAGSASKRDPRSDLAFLGGIFFYSLTGSPPSNLLDAEGRMPHQTPESVKLLKAASEHAFLDLQYFFDRAFSQKLSGRFASADEMSSYVAKLISREPKGSHLTSDEELAEIAARLNSEGNRRLVALKSLYDEAMRIIQEVHAQIARSVAPTYQSYQTGYVNFIEGKRNTLGFTHFATHNHRFSPEFLISVIGDELVITVDGSPFYRTDVNMPIFDEAFREQTKRMYLAGLRQLTETPLPPAV